jgi:hypothetical protein
MHAITNQTWKNTEQSRRAEERAKKQIMGQKSDHSINKAKSSIYLIILFLCHKWVTKK